MKRFIITIFLAHFLLTAFAQNNVIIQASDTQVNAGDEITYQITINPNGNSVGAFSLELAYDSNLFQILGLEGADNWTVVSNPNTPGIIKVAGYKVGGENTIFQAFNLTFNAIGQAGQTSQIQLNVELVADSNGQTLNHQHSNGSILISGSCRYNDSLALVAVYDALNGDNWYSWYKWDLNQPMDTWRGITLNANGCVDKLDLDEKGISGTLAPEIGNLSEMTVLDFAENGISGALPASIGNLTNLKTLSLSQNQLTGVIPYTIGNLTNLEYLSLYGNQLTGSIPTNIGNLTNLTGLVLAGNNLTGSIPSTIGSLTQLTYLYLNGNNLSGGIPSTIGNLTSLKYLYLHNNQLSGAVPTGLGNLSNLDFLYLSNNQLTSLPSTINNLVNLSNFITHDNLFTSLPYMGDLDNLRSLQLHNNQIGGSLPEWLIDMDELVILRIQNNQLSGCYDSNLAELCTQLFSSSSRNASISDGNNFDAPWESFCANGTCSSDICGDDANTLLLLPFDNTLNGIDGETPTASSAVGFASGRHSNALNVNGSTTNPSLSYAVENNLNLHKGTLEAWVKPAWNGNDGQGYTILSYGGWGGMIILKDGANNLRLIMNLWSPSGYPEIGVFKNISDWQANQWKHIAFTWGDGELKLYIDGSLAAQQTYTVPLATIYDTQFQIGEHGSIDWQGAIDHLRISDIIRSQSDIIDFKDNCVGTKIADNQTIDTHNFPNPFTNQTTITYTLPEDSPVTLTVYDGTGRQVALLHHDETKSAGTHATNFEGGAYPAGIYYYTIQAGAYSGTQKMILMK